MLINCATDMAAIRPFCRIFFVSSQAFQMKRKEKKVY